MAQVHCSALFPKMIQSLFQQPSAVSAMLYNLEPTYLPGSPGGPGLPLVFATPL
jgi:hypothetical protein